MVGRVVLAGMMVVEGAVGSTAAAEEGGAEVAVTAGAGLEEVGKKL